MLGEARFSLLAAPEKLGKTVVVCGFDGAFHAYLRVVILKLSGEPLSTSTAL
jgi:hypothetical protein